MKAIGRFLQHVFVRTPLDAAIGLGLVMLCMFIIVGPFFGFGAGNDKRDKKPRGSEKKTSTINL